MKIYEICFSPTGGTKRVTEILSRALADEVIPVDLTARQTDFARVKLTGEEVVLIAVPSYSGRVPAVAAERLGALHATVLEPFWFVFMAIGPMKIRWWN